MRKDMFEVIIERPRWGSRSASRKGRLDERTARAFDRAPSKQGMRRLGLTKSLNENLAPLLRFLHQSVGRPWNKVRSEMSAVLSMSSAVQKHVIDHVKQFVEENPRMIDGVPHEPIARGGAKGEHMPLARYRWHNCFYVCPKTGLLRASSPVPRKRGKDKAAIAAPAARPA